MSVIGSNALAGASGQAAAGYEIERSLRFNSGDSAYLNRTPSSAGNRRTWTWAGWLKKTVFGTSRSIFSTFAGAHPTTAFIFTSGDQLWFFDYNTSYNFQLITNAVLRDPSAWYHLVLTVDTTQSTASDRVKIYINGEQVTSFATETYPTQDFETDWNSTTQHDIGKHVYYLDAYLADVHFIDGQALAASDFGEYDDNGVWQPKAYAGTYGTNGFHLDFSDNSSDAALGTDSSGNSNTWTVNNITAEAPGLATAKQGMDVVTYTGTNSAQSITSLAFQPDFIWFKARSYAGSHALVDSVRGISKQLQSNTTNAESTNSAGAGPQSFDSNGFTLGTESSATGSTNGSQTYVAWCWKAGGTASSNTDGSITSQVSANTTYGFSIVSYTGNGTNGATVGHGLGAVPSMIIVKNRDIGTDGHWAVRHSTTGSSYLLLNLTNGGNSNTAVWTSTSPTSDVFSIGTSTAVNGNGNDLIAYCWSEVAGFSKFGSYTGTGAVGHKITTGFKPAYILFKRTDSLSNWRIVDEKRGTSSLNAETNEAEQTLNFAINADGFTINETGNNPNASGGTYIYAAFAGTPAGEDVDSLFDSPTNGIQTDTGLGGEVSGNYCTWNPLQTNASVTLSNGNLNFTTNAGRSAVTIGTLGVSSGKWYYETVCTASPFTPPVYMAGVVNLNTFNLPTGTTGVVTGVYAYSLREGGTIVDGSFINSGLATAAVNDVIGIALDLDAGTLKAYKNNTLLGTIASGLSGTFAPYINAETLSTPTSSFTNFGQRAFAYTAPSGFKALNTANLSDPTIADGSDYMDAVLYTGTNASKTITGLNFSPDFIWTKSRSRIDSHGLHDIVRGRASNLYSDLTNGENISSASADLVSFDSNGYTLGTVEQTAMNRSGETYVGWTWDAGTSDTSVTAGSLNSSVYDQSQTWSTGASTDGSNYNSTTSANAFDDTISTFWQTTDNATQTYAFTSLSSGTLEVYLHGNPSTYSIEVNGSAISSPAATTAAWVTFAANASTITSVDLVRTGTKVAVGGWRLNGKLLVDSGVSVTNVPSIASIVRANPSAGFSIVKATISSSGTIGHGLNAKPHMVFRKRTNGTSDWYVAVDTGSVEGYLLLNGTAGITSQSQNLTTNTFDAAWLGNSGEEWINYAFAPVEGYSAFGSYTGNGSTDGPFVYTGFRPRWIMWKPIGAGQWFIHDTARSTYNYSDLELAADTSAAEYSASGVGAGERMDILSNGFKARTNNVASNDSGSIYIYACFSENPFKYARAR